MRVLLIIIVNASGEAGFVLRHTQLLCYIRLYSSSEVSSNTAIPKLHVVVV